jgi:hypothetical protein
MLYLFTRDSMTCQSGVRTESIFWGNINCKIYMKNTSILLLYQIYDQKGMNPIRS